MKICEYQECHNTTSNPKYCSLACSNRQAALRTKKERRGSEKVCIYLGCGEKFWTRDSRQKFCSRSCSATVGNRTSPKRVKVVRPPRKTRLDRWILGEWDGNTKYGLSATIRNFLLKESDYTCQDGRSGCGGFSGYNPKSGKSCLTVDHTDGNSSNQDRSNLVVMCPNCHSMTPTYGALNKGNGRKYRYGVVT